jgi:hypothetical protein
MVSWERWILQGVWELSINCCCRAPKATKSSHSLGLSEQFVSRPGSTRGPDDLPLRKGIVEEFGWNLSRTR